MQPAQLRHPHFDVLLALGKLQGSIQARFATRVQVLGGNSVCRIPSSFFQKVDFGTELSHGGVNGPKRGEGMIKVEELAWLVKDNLHTKHLVLSAEELFIEFLEPDYEREEALVLEPMLSYQRMLLHRLADCFRLIHESLGEGDDRHLVVERGKDSAIPLMLVSDVLESCYGEAHHAPACRQLLMRHSHETDEVQEQRTFPSPVVSLEEREAAYQAARERIFSDSSLSPEDSIEQRGGQRVRPVPIVARRMIAHALGKASPLLTLPTTQEEMTSPESPGPEVLKCQSRHSPAKAAQRMFSQALGFPVAAPSSRGAQRQSVTIQIQTAGNEDDCRQSSAEISVVSLRKNRTLDSSRATEDDEDLKSGALGQNADSASFSRADFRITGVPAARSLRKDQPEAAARRMFAQALGLPQPVSSSMFIDKEYHLKSSVDECFVQTTGSYDSSRGKSTSALNVSSAVFLPDETHSFGEDRSSLVGSGIETPKQRKSRMEIKVLECSKGESAFQGEEQKGGGFLNNPRDLRKIKEQGLQEDQETGEVFYVRS